MDSGRGVLRAGVALLRRRSLPTAEPTVFACSAVRENEWRREGGRRSDAGTVDTASCLDSAGDAARGDGFLAPDGIPSAVAAVAVAAGVAVVFIDGLEMLSIGVSPDAPVLVLRRFVELRRDPRVSISPPSSVGSSGALSSSFLFDARVGGFSCIPP
jgi:hypothetical protein